MHKQPLHHTLLVGIALTNASLNLIRGTAFQIYDRRIRKFLGGLGTESAHHFPVFFNPTSTRDKVPGILYL